MGSGSEETLRTGVEQGALAVVLLASLLLVAACGAELLRHRGRAGRMVRLADRLLPAPARRFAAVLVAAVVVALPAGVPAGATPTPQAGTVAPAPPGSLRDWLRAPAGPPASTSTSTTTTTTTPSTAPSRRSAPEPVTAPAPPPVTPAPRRTVVVVPGDCLWDLAARELGPDASAAQIDAAWRAIWATNHDRIGADPNLIHPGLVLDLPAPNVP